MAVALGLLAALLWGAADFLVRGIGRRLGVHRAMLYAQGASAVMLGAWVLVSGALPRALHAAPASAWLAALAIAPVGLLATATLYRAFQVGRVGIVAPVGGAYGAVTALLSWLTGEAIGALVLGGMTLTVLGLVLVCIPARGAAAGRGAERSGADLAAVACFAFGVQFWIQGRFAVPALGAVLPVWLYYVFSLLTLASAAVWRRPVLRLRAREAGAVAGTAIVATGGFVVLSVGLATGHVGVVTVLASLQSAVTIGLACILQAERLARHQWLGVAAVVAGLALVRAG